MFSVEPHRVWVLMINSVIYLPSVLALGDAALCVLGHKQNFKVEKFDIKVDGGSAYVAVEAATGRVFVSRGTHMMVVDGKTGKVVGEIPETPGVHGAGIATKAGHGFTTNGRSSRRPTFGLRPSADVNPPKPSHARLHAP